MVVEGLGTVVSWLFHVPARFSRIVGVSVGLNGVSERKTQ
jgi:hypothetical protein